MTLNMHEDCVVLCEHGCGMSNDGLWCVTLSAKAVWATTKDADKVAKVWIASIIARKSRGDVEICCNGGADVLGPADSEGAGGIGGAREASDVGSGAVAAGVVDVGIWGSSVGTRGGD